jgi:hypothetical protein
VARHTGGASTSGSPGVVMVVTFQITSEGSLDAACGGGYSLVCVASLYRGEFSRQAYEVLNFNFPLSGGVY